MKILRSRNLMGCLFALLLTLPLLNVLGRVAYTVVNKNAYLNYSGTNTETYNEVNYLELENNKRYHFSSEIVSASDYNYTSTSDFYVSNISNVIGSSVNLSSVNRIRPYKSGSIIYLAMYQGDINVTYFRADSSTISFNFTFLNATNYISTGTVNLFNGWIYSIENEYNNYIDNAFEYSISKITDNNNIGELRFFTWFADLFLDLDNSQNALYINFINWYFNYAILVSAVYVLFLVLMWFINWVRRLLERGMSFGNGRF